MYVYAVYTGASSLESEEQWWSHAVMFNTTDRYGLSLSLLARSTIFPRIYSDLAKFRTCMPPGLRSSEK